MFSLVPWRRDRNTGALAQRDPFQQVRDEFQTLFNRFFGEWPMALSDGWGLNRGWGLEFDEKDNEVVVRAALPGFDVKDIDVQLAQNVLTIEARHGAEEGKENGSQHFSQVRRSVTLPSGLDYDKVEATYKNGVLELHVPRTPDAQGRKIEIKS